MLIKEKVKLSMTGEDGKVHRMTVTISGRTEEELKGRIAKTVDRYLYRGWVLR